MGFWSALGKIALPVASVLVPGSGLAAAAARTALTSAGAAIGSGGGNKPNPPGGPLDTLGRGAAEAAASAAEGRALEAELLRRLFSDVSQQQLTREQILQQARSAAARQALGSALLMGFQPSGRFPIAITDEARKALAKIYEQSSSLMQRPDLGVPGVINPMDRPEFVKLLNPGFWEKVGSAAGFTLPFLSELLPRLIPTRTPLPSVPPVSTGLPSSLPTVPNPIPAPPTLPSKPLPPIGPTPNLPIPSRPLFPGR